MQSFSGQQRGLSEKPPVGQSAVGGLRPTVFVVDDDVSVREALGALIETTGWEVRCFESAASFLACPPTPGPNCLVLDVNLPDLNGLDLQARVSVERREMPIIFLTGRSDVPMSVRAMKAGAIEFLTKPFDDEKLLSAIEIGLSRSYELVEEQASLRVLQNRYESLSRREREVMTLVAAGLLNKQVGGELGISEITVKAHRGRVMEKMKAASLAGLVRIAARLGLSGRVER